MSEHDAFISYAVEDNDFAAAIAHGLQANGLSVWFAPLSLRAGDKLLDSIEKGLSESRSGILILSERYLDKSWTSHEMDILIRQHVERDKKLFPIWLDVGKKEIEARHVSLSGIVGITETDDISHVISELVRGLSDDAPNRAVMPVWEDPAYRFLNGLGEANLQSSDGPATTIYEFLIHSAEEEFPLWLAGKTYSREDLLYHVAQVIGPDPRRVKRWVGEDGYQKLWDLCVQHGVNPNHFY